MLTLSLQKSRFFNIADVSLKKLYVTIEENIPIYNIDCLTSLQCD